MQPPPSSLLKSCAHIGEGGGLGLGGGGGLGLGLSGGSGLGLGGGGGLGLGGTGLGGGGLGGGGDGLGDEQSPVSTVKLTIGEFVPHTTWDV